MDYVKMFREAENMGEDVNFDDLNGAANEIERLRAWVKAIGNLPDVDADNRSWMARDALAGEPAPKSP